MRPSFSLLFLAINVSLFSCIGEDSTSANSEANISTEFNPAERLKGVWESSLELPQSTRKITIQFASDSTMTMIHAISKAETGEPYLDTTQFFIQYNSQFPVITLTDSMSTYGLFYRNLGDQMLFAFVEGADEYMHFTNYGEINDIQGVWTTDTMCNHYCDVM